MGQNHYTMVGDGKRMGQNNYMIVGDDEPMDRITI